MASKNDLPNGCYCSTPSVNPANWKQIGASIKKDWYIQYWFYDGTGAKRLRIVKGMNDYKDLHKRRTATEVILARELELLQAGFNPIAGAVTASAMASHEIEPNTKVIDALEEAHKRLSCCKETKNQIKLVIGYIETAAAQLGYHTMAIADIRQRHVAYILERIEENKGVLSASSYNHYRNYLGMLFKKLRSFGVTDVNPRNLDTRSETKMIREILTPEQVKIVNDHLHANHYNFWRFWQIFSQSGARKTELIGLKMEAVDLYNQRYKVIIRKRKKYEEVPKTITKSILPLWNEIMAEAKPGDYLFSWDLKPGPLKVRTDQINRRWREHVKLKLGIKADFYSEKHRFTTTTMNIILGEIKDAAKIAAGHNSHTSEDMVMTTYDVERESRVHKRLKKV